MNPTPEQLTPNRLELNPFAFPPETNSFFTLLVIAVLLWMLELGQILAGATRSIIFSTTLLLFLVLLLAGGIYITHPLRIRHGQKLREIKPEEDDKFIAAVQEIVKESGLRPMPQLLTDSKPTSMSGQAFGVMNNHSLRLGGGLRLLLRRESEVFKAIIRHEIAHIANKDVSRAYLTRSIWLAVLYVTVLPMLILMGRFFLQQQVASLILIPIVLLSLVKIGLVSLLITAIYGNLLRYREYYADLKAKVWGSGQALAHIFQRNSKNKETRHWWYILRLHPTLQQRLTTLQDTDELFRYRPSLGFFIGTLLGMLLNGLYAQKDALLGVVQVLASIPVSIFGEESFQEPIGGIVVAILYQFVLAIPLGILLVFLSDSLGVAIQKDVIARLDKGRPAWTTYLSLWMPAIFVSVGFQLGSFLSIASSLELIPSLLGSIKGILYLGMLFVLSISFAGSTWVGFFCLGVLTRKFIGIHTGDRPPTRGMFLLRLQMAFLLVLLYSPILFAQLSIEQSAAEMNSDLLMYFLPGFALAAIMAVFLTGGLFLVTWVIAAVNDRSRLRCPYCGQISQHRYAVGHSCEHCNKMLSGWLYLNIK